MTEPAFHYERSLQDREIRLIQLSPPQQGDEFQCSLVYKYLDSENAYNALSYVWGDPSDKRQIICDGKTCLINVNLFYALSRMRSTRADVLLWADALCIDQANDTEKTNQVRMMGDIYSQAQLVVVWLGLEEQHDREAYSDACRLYNVLGIVSPSTETSLAKSDETIDLGKLGLPERLFDSRWTRLIHLLSKGWYSRVWIIQEFLKARSSVFLCDKLEMDPEVLLNVSTCFGLYHQLRAILTWAPSGDPSLANIRLTGPSLRLLRQLHKEDRLNLLTSLGTSRFFKSTDPRDRIFALIGLQHYIPLTFIDYSQELSYVELQVTLAILSDEETPVDVLAHTTVFGTRRDLPTWVPAWGNESSNVMAFSEMVRPLDYDFGEPEFKTENDKTLHVRGKIVDRIHCIVWDTPYEDNAPAGAMFESLLLELITRLYAWITNVIQLSDHFNGSRTDLSSKEMLWRALVCDGAPNYSAAPSHYEDAFDAYIEFLRDFPSTTRDLTRLMEKRSWSGILNEEEEVQADHLSNQSEHLEQRRQDFQPYESHFQRACVGRRLCFTERGYIAWVSRNAKEGNEVAFVYGGHCPFVLRSPDSGQELQATSLEDPLNPKRWLVGDCYVQGLMHGEAIKMLDIPECMIALV